MSQEDLLENPLEIEERLGYRFRSRHLLALAFTHRSYVNEDPKASAHNERLEFLGDSVLGLLVSEFLYRHYPETAEGQLSYLRSRLVEASTCALFIEKLKVDSYILLGRGEKLNKERGRFSILADLFEAIIGAIYLDGGLEAAGAFLFDRFSEEMEAILKTPIKNWKAVLQDYCQRKYRHPPTYVVMSEEGPDHRKIFRISVYINDLQVGHGEGRSKKEAQQAAAQDAVEKLGIET